MSGEIESQLSELTGKPEKILQTIPLGGGCIHHATRIITGSGEFFLKWNDSGPADIFIREAQCLRELALSDPDPLVIPTVLSCSGIKDKPGYLLLPFLVRGNRSLSEEINLGRGLARLHLYRGTAFGFHDDNYCGLTIQCNRWETDWIKFYGTNRLAFILRLIELKRGLTNPELAVFEKLISKLPRILPSVSEPSLIHGDLWSGNYMITTQGPALIDPASYYADREMEFGILTLFGGFGDSFWQGYEEVFPLPYGWKERNPLYQLYHLLNHHYLFGGDYGRQAIRIAGYFAG